MKSIRIFFIILLLLVLAMPIHILANQENEEEIVTADAQFVHVNYIDNAIIMPFFGTGIANRSLIYGDYIPLYLSSPWEFEPYHMSEPPYKNIFDSAQEVIDAANNINHPLHSQAVNLRNFAEAMLAMEERENTVKYNLSQQDIPFALNRQNIFSYAFGDTSPSSIWKYSPSESLQSPYQPDYLMQQDDSFIAPMNQWNSITYNSSEEYIEELDELLHPVPDMSFLDGVFARSGPLGDMAGMLADVAATPYTFLPAIFMLGMDIYLRSQNEIGFLYPTTTGYEISPCPESGMVMIKNNNQQMIYNITGGEGGSMANIPSGEFGTFFVDAVNSFSGGIRPTASIINDDLLAGGRVQYNDVPSQYQSQDYSLNLESHVGISQTNLELCDTVICKIKGSGSMIMLPFKIGCWFQCDQGQTGNIKSKTTIGVRFKDDEIYYTYDLADCVLENINSIDETAADQDGILMWSGVISINAEEYGKTEIEEVYLALSSSAKKTSGLNKVNCYTSLSFSPYFLKPIITLPEDIEFFPGEEVIFQTEFLERPANAVVNVSWEIPSGSETLEGNEISRTFNQSGIYDCQLIVDPEYQPRPPAVEVTDPGEIFWNTDAGKIVFPFQVKVLPSLDLKVDWELPAYVPLNTRNHPKDELYPGRKTTITLYVTNEGVKDFHSSDYQGVPLTLSLFIDNDYNHYFDSVEKVWEEEIDDFAANSSMFYHVELLFSLDKKMDDADDETIVYWPNLHDCQFRVTELAEEENKDNNVIQNTMDFISSPELDFSPPDFVVENAGFSVDQYKNMEVSFDLAEKSEGRSIIDKWNEYHEDNPFIPQWGPIPYELWLRDSQNNVNELLTSGEFDSIYYQEERLIRLERLNLDYIPPGRYSLYLGINPDMLLPESRWDNNHGFMDWFTIADNATLPWFTRGGDRGHTGCKELGLKPPLITEWVIETNGIPVDMVCNSNSFYVLTTSGTIEKYGASGGLQYSIDGFDGTPLQSTVMLLIHPDTENERLLAFSDDYRLIVVDTQTGNKIWTSEHVFGETTYGSDKKLKEYSRSLDYDGYYLITGWPVALYRFDSTMVEPMLLWEKDKERKGDVFLLGNCILAGEYLYSMDGEELEQLRWMDNQAIRYLQNIFTDRYRYNFISGQTTRLDDLRDPGSIFSDKVLSGRKMQYFDFQGNQQWTLPDKIEQEYYAVSTPRLIPVYAQTENIVCLGSDNEGYAYCINNGYQLLAVNLANGEPAWYREFIETPDSSKNLKEGYSDDLTSQLRLKSAFHQTPLNMDEGFAVDITRVIPFRNSLLVSTIGKKIYCLYPANLDHLEVQGNIPSIFYGPSNLIVRTRAMNEQGAEINLEDKITVTGDYINQNNPRYYGIGEDISLPVRLPDSEKKIVDYPEISSAISNDFLFIDIQNLSPLISVPLVVDNIQSRPRISKKNAPAGDDFLLSMDDESGIVYRPRSDSNSVTLYYSSYVEEDVSRVLYEHSYHLSASIRSPQFLMQDYEFIDLRVHVPEGININNFSVKINKEPYHQWSLHDNHIIIDCLNAFLEHNTNSLNIIILETSE